MQVIYDWMKNIIIFMILVTVIMNLLGKSAYKKYVGIVTGLLLVLYVVKPIITLAGNIDFFNFSLGSYTYQVQSEDLSEIIFDLENDSNSAIMKEYKKLLMEQTNKLLKEKGLYVTEMNIIIDENSDNDTYGTIVQMDVEASYIKEENKEIDIEPITIDKIKIAEEKLEEPDSDTKIYSPMEINIKNVLADFYNIDLANINISIREDHNG